MKRFFLIGILLTFIFQIRNANAQSNEENFEILLPEHGLSHNVVTCMLQDSKGFAWFGTLDGLNLYDGYSFKVFKTEDSVSGSVSGNYIRSMFEDSDGDLWIGTEENGLNLFNREQYSFSRFDATDNELLKSNKITSIYEDAKKKIWIGTNNGLYLFDKGTLVFKNIPEYLVEMFSEKSIKCIQEDTSKNLWIGTSNGLYCIEQEKKKCIEYKHNTLDKNSLSNNDIHCIIQSRDGVLLIGTNSGLNVYDPGLKQIERVKESASGKIDFSTSEIYSIAEDRTGNLWFGTFGSGLVKWNNKNGETTIYTINPLYKNSISNDFILSLLIDKSGLLWIGTYGGGVNKLNLVKISFGEIAIDRTFESTLISEEIYTLYDDVNRNLWIGTDKGLSILNKIEGRYYNVSSNKENNLKSNAVYSLLEDKDGNVWIGTNGGGLHMIDKEKIANKDFVFSNYNKENTNESLLSNDILCLYEDSKNVLWIGTTEGLNTFNYLTGEWRSFVSSENSKSLPGDIIQSVYEDSKGFIWIGTDNGLSQYRRLEDDFISFVYKEGDTLGIPNNNIYTINEDKSGLIWIGTDAGISCFNHETGDFKTFTYEHGLPDNVIYGILIDDENNLWMSTNNGLSKLIRGSNLKNFSFVNYNSSNWLHCDNFNIGAYHKNRDGVLYFGCNKGLTYFHPEDIKGNLYIPPVYITGFKLFYQDVPIKEDGSSVLQKHISYLDEIILNHKQDIISFEFAALNYIQSEKNNYAFMLENFDDDWIYPREDKRSVTFTNLDPGEYIFRVRASNNNGIWNNDGAQIKITIKPPFWRTWWFYISCAVGAIVCFYIYVHVRTHKLRVQRKILEDKVKERTEEVLTQKEELEAALENLKKTQTQLVDKEKMASLGQLTAGVAHEINNPINFVSGNVAPLDRDIKDLFAILDKYEEAVKENNVQEQFESVEKLKQQLDYDFLKVEIGDLIKGIKEGAHRTSEIVKSLRSFSRLDENDLKVANINHGIESTLLILRNKIKNRIEVVKDFGDIPEVLCYPGKLNQVFMNVLTNAEQAIIGEGKIYVKTRFKSGYISISIKDTGVGMTEDVRKKVFDPFFTTKDVGDGTGLGLSISFGIIETHHGTITVNSAPGEGTEFIIKLPERIDN